MKEKERKVSGKYYGHIITLNIPIEFVWDFDTDRFLGIQYDAIGLSKHQKYLISCVGEQLESLLHSSASFNYLLENHNEEFVKFLGTIVDKESGTVPQVFKDAFSDEE